MESLHTPFARPVSFQPDRFSPRVGKTPVSPREHALVPEGKGHHKGLFYRVRGLKIPELDYSSSHPPLMCCKTRQFMRYPPALSQAFVLNYFRMISFYRLLFCYPFADFFCFDHAMISAIYFNLHQIELY